MNGVKFGEKHTIIDWDLLMTSKNIGEAVPKTNFVTIEGRNGSIDLTDWTGEVKFDDRTLVFDFDIFDTKNFYETQRKISNYLNGKKMKIILDQDPNYYYYGRCSITNSQISMGIGHITIQAICEPYKLKIYDTVIIKAIVPNQKIVLDNERKLVMPEVIATTDAVFEYENSQFSISANSTYKSPDFVLKEGKNEITMISGTGTITFTYQEGAL